LLADHTFLYRIDNTWTLFLDRDGVLNYEKKDDYIRDVSEFNLYEGVREALGKITPLFQHVIVVTNQRGIGRGFMSEDDLYAIHENLLALIQQNGGHIHQFYFAPDLDRNAYHRKPNIGMGLQAKQDFPGIDFEKSIMVGNNLSDMEFGKRLAMKTVFVETTKTIEMPNEWIDLKYNTFVDFCFDLRKVSGI
jgi:histidinol-phosphate phosphatase family protein